MKFFLPDAQDLVDPTFDFTRETRSPDRIRHRDDLYAHEVFTKKAYDGVLLSKGIVEAVGGATGRYAQTQRLRLLRDGAKEFFRIHGPKRLELMGDCGAFTYIKERKPPFTIDEVIDFYDRCGFDYGISVDHIIVDHRPDWGVVKNVPIEVRERQDITLQLARDFWHRQKTSQLGFTPIGVAQGWNPKSYAKSVKALQKIGYDYIAVGGLVPLKTPDLIEIIQAVGAVRDPRTRIHLLGVTRIEHMGVFESLGVVSFDSTSPLRQAFMDDKANYYTPTRTYSALRIPQVHGNMKLEKRIRAGEVEQDVARKAEQKCLRFLSEFDAGKRKAPSVLRALQEYEAIHSPARTRVEAYRETLDAAPWKNCPCDVCQVIKYHVIVFRGAERNRRRGFHNVWVFYGRMQKGLREISTIKSKQASRSSRQHAVLVNS